MLRLGCKCSASLQPKTLHFVHNFRLILPYSTSTSAVNEAFTNYLVTSLGFTQQQALSTSTKLPPRKKKVDVSKLVAKAGNVVHFFKQLGFNDTHLIKAVSLCPRILSANADKTLNPKVMLLQEMGFSRPDLVHVISINPLVLFRRLNPLLPRLRVVMGSDESFIKLFKRSIPFISLTTLDNIVSNVALLKNDYGVDIGVIRKYIVSQPSSFVRATKFFQNAVIRVEEELRIPRSSRMFLYGISLLCTSSNKSLECKRQVFRSFGWTEYHISELIRRNPAAIRNSKETNKKKLGFLMNKLHYEPDYLASHPALFTYSLEKRMLPRHQVLRILKEKGLSDYSFYYATKIPETKFLQILVEPFKQAVPGLLEIYQNSKGCPEPSCCRVMSDYAV